MDPRIAKMKDALVLHVGEFYASHLKALLKRKSSLEMNNIRVSLGNYFKAKDDQYWESLYTYCKKRNYPWNLYFICNKFALAFDRALASRMNEVYLLNEAFLSSHSLALALGKSVPSNTPQPANAVDLQKEMWADNERKVQAHRANIKPVPKNAIYSPPRRWSRKQSCSRAEKPDYSFWDDWDYD